MADYIPKLLDIGVRSLKIEGRMRSHYYLATVISSYHKIIEAYSSNTLTKELLEKQKQILSRVANRETSTHYFTHEADESDQYYTGRQEMSNQDFLAVVLDYDKNSKIVTISERNYFEPGTEVEIFTPSGKTVSFTVQKIYNEEMQEIEKACHPEEILKLRLDEEVERDSMMRLKIRKD